jgi:ketosteroid isomerase-like protein
MLSWLAKQVFSFVMARNNRGDIRWTLALEAPDVVLHFPGDNSWSGTYRGKAQVRQWLQRFARTGLQTFPDEVVVAGFPWKMTACIRGTDLLRAPDGSVVYENRFVIWGHLRWGRLVDYEVYEDTIAPRALDEYLQQVAPELSVPVPTA